MEILTGIGLGLSTLLFIGPVFFYLLKSSIESGFKAGLAIAIGIILGDIICVVLALNGLGNFLTSNPLIQVWMSLIGGVILLGIGLKYLLKPKAKKGNIDKYVSKSLFMYGLNGFLINFVNPFVFVVWIGFTYLCVTKYGNNSSIIISMISALIVIFITDCLKAFFAQKLTLLIKPVFLEKLFRVFGVIMIFFSLRLFWEFYKMI